MSVTYEDLTNDFPDVESDTRYEFNELTIEAVPYIAEYQALYETLISATTTTTRQAAWSELEEYKETDEYATYVEPFLITAAKMQTLEDKTISAQRFAKRVNQQWIISATEPEENEQAVGDVWFKLLTDDGGDISFVPYYLDDDGEYQLLNYLTAEGQITANQIVSSLPDDAADHPTTVYWVTG